MSRITNYLDPGSYLFELSLCTNLKNTKYDKLRVYISDPFDKNSLKLVFVKSGYTRFGVKTVHLKYNKYKLLLSYKIYYTWSSRLSRIINGVNSRNIIDRKKRYFFCYN